MKITMTLSRYLAGLYFKNFMFLLLILLGIIYIFDTIELIRRASDGDVFSLGLLLQMGLLKLPQVGQIIFPFAILFAAMFSFWQLNRRHELIVVRSAGFSVWQFLAPVVGVAIFIGALQITVINPIGALLIGKFEQMEQKYIKQETSQIAVFKEGLWLRQSTDLKKPADSNKSDYVIFHAERILQKDWSLRGVHVLYFDAQDRFQQRMDATSAVLRPNQWEFSNVTIHSADGDSYQQSRYILPTRLNIADVEDSFASVNTKSFWSLPAYIQTLEETGFNSSSVKVYYHNLLAQPLLFGAMILLAASVSMRPPRFRGGLMLFSIGVFTGFVVFFMSSFLQALGASQQIPAILAAWSPALICFMLGLSMIISLEDG